MHGTDDVESGPADRELLPEIERALAATAGHHPGIIAEEVVARLLAAYDLLPRQTHHRERRRNHEERIRRYSHEVYRDRAGGQPRNPGREISARVTMAFIATRKSPAAGS